VAISWTGIVKTKTLAGTLASNNPDTVSRYTCGALDCRGEDSDISGKHRAEGHFHFEQTAPGIYILHVAANKKALVTIGKWKGISLSNSRRLR